MSALSICSARVRVCLLPSLVDIATRRKNYSETMCIMDDTLLEGEEQGNDFMSYISSSKHRHVGENLYWRELANGSSVLRLKTEEV